jgi:hypothetical protein
MESNMLYGIRSALIKSYRPRNESGVSCACCSRQGVLLSFHAIEYYQDEALPLPKSFVPMSQSRGSIRGSFPICIICAPPCRKCGLPKDTETLLEFYDALDKSDIPGQIVGGNGRCKHLHASLFLHALIKRIFYRGRFARK